jgi:superfamily II DNA or RNA helicase
MATGSGKTLIMHINYHQFFHYKPFEPDNIVLITPNEGLSKQHFDELGKSGIPCKLFGGGLSGLYGSTNGRGVLVLEITKLGEEKKGGGVTIPLDVFEGRNLVFVDEGHKGKMAEEQKWKKLRDKLAEEGFTFEYSATFGQILSEKNPEILKEYAKSIVCDYSYKYFYLDGYGKDFSVFNVAGIRVSEKEFQETMFAANLLAFYEQFLIYENHKSLAKEYNIEKPLWIFVGTTVTGKEEESDVIQIVEFLRKAIQDQKWLKEKTAKIIKGNSGLKNDNGKDVFNNKFEYLKKNGYDLQDIYRLIFGGKGEFGIYDLRNAEGELGLKVGENNYFGVINIGDVSDFKKKLEKKGIITHREVLSGSLFDDIKRDESTINILIGSKKFIEGWDTWRVSSMGLLNIGTGQGPQIIQLFGRGVRLKGKGFSLKRSGQSGPVSFLEFLNIYGIKADYLSKFLDAIRKEDVEFETIEIPVKPQYKEKWNSLNILSKDENKRFEEEKILPLEIDEKLTVFLLDLSPKIKAYHGIQEEIVTGELEEVRIPLEFVDVLNWQRILKDIYEYKIIKGYLNLIFDRKTLESVLYSNRYKIIAPVGLFSVKQLEDLEQIQTT